MIILRLLRNVPVPPGQAAGLAAAVLAHRLRPAPLPGPRSAHRTAGAMLLLAGGTLTGWALAERAGAERAKAGRAKAERSGAGRTGGQPLQQDAGSFDLERPERLVTTGPYALTRHPMYVGWWLIHLGAGVLAGSAWVLATLPAAVLAEHPGVLAEEHLLARKFGAQFTGYARRVPRYLGPGIPGRDGHGPAL